MHTVLVLGGYGYFGQRIAAALAGDGTMRLLIGGRSLERAQAACAELGLPRENAAAIDAADPALVSRLRESEAKTLILSGGEDGDRSRRDRQRARSLVRVAARRTGQARRSAQPGAVGPAADPDEPPDGAAGERQGSDVRGASGNRP